MPLVDLFMVSHIHGDKCLPLLPLGVAEATALRL